MPIPKKPVAPKTKTKTKSPAKMQETVIPAEDFANKLAELFRKTDKLLAFREGKDNKKLAASKSYNNALADLGARVSHVKSAAQAALFTTQEALVRLRVTSTSDSNPKLAQKAVKLSQQIAGVRKRVQKLNDSIAGAFKNNTILLERIKPAFKGADAVFAEAAELRKQAVQLHQQASPQTARRSATVHVPTFAVVDGFTVIGDPTGKAQRKITEKLAHAIQMGADPVPDPYTVLFQHYTERDIAITRATRNAVRYIVQFSAGRKPLPKRPTLIELYEALQVDRSGHYKTEGTNAMFKAVLGNITRKAATPECKKFVLDVDPSLKESDFESAVVHLTQADSRGKKVLDDVRVVYGHALAKWFHTYVPVIV
jgi:hypothetical protein